MLLALFHNYVPHGIRESVHITLSSNGELLIFDKHSRRHPPWGRLSIFANCPPHQVSGLPQGLLSTFDDAFPLIDTASTKSLAWAKGRLATCSSGHTCQTFRSKDKLRLPTRLVAIPQDPVASGIKLQHSLGLLRDTEYVALSHCWGNKTPQCVTTPKNLQSQLNKIPWSSVPQTFRDAILFTRALGLEYIWIDSVCIVQSDEADWFEESARMFEYYSNAHVTLAAASSPDCDGGLFIKKPCNRIILPNVSFGGRDFGLFASETPSEMMDFTDAATGLGGDVERKYPLLSRGWAFQERLVSPRVIYFTKSQLIWDCYSGCAFEENDVGCDTEPRDLLYQGLKQNYLRLLHQPGTSLASTRWPRRDLVIHNLNKFQLSGPRRVSSTGVGHADNAVSKPVITKGNKGGEGDTQDEEEYDEGVDVSEIDDQERLSSRLEKPASSSFEWNHVLKAYSQLQLSDPRDRLPAIAAIAEQVLSREYDDPAGEYLCGLRKQALHIDLLWTPSSDSATRQLCGPEKYVAPSWSWASFPGQIADSVHYEWRGSSTINFVDDALRFNESRRFSRVLGGHIVIEGPVVECIWDVSFGPDLTTFEGPQILQASSHGNQDPTELEQFEVELVPDYALAHDDLEGMMDQGHVEVCLLQTWACTIEKTSGALALYKNKTTGTYTRLGARLRDRESAGEDRAWGLVGKKVFSKAKRRALQLV